MLAGAVKAGKELHDDKGVDIFDEDMSRGDRAFHLQEQLAVQFRRGYLSHTSALCKFAFLTTPFLFLIQCMHLNLHQHWTVVLADNMCLECCCLLRN